MLAVYAGSRADELSVVDWDDATKDLFIRQQFVAQHRWYAEQYGGASFDVVVVDGVDAGRLYVDRRPDELRIVDLALLPEHRGRGVGTELVRRLMDEAAGGGKRLSMHVERFNRALQLYLRLGFGTVADEGVYLLLEWSPT